LLAARRTTSGFSPFPDAAPSSISENRQSGFVQRFLSAVEVSGAQNLTDYILRAAVEKAHTDLANKTTFSLDARGWAEFIKMLDAPVRDMPGLKKLLTTPSIFERNSKA
jgi:uncharacterized protein (DUF1778 family)